MWQNILQGFQQELNRLSATLSFAPAWAIWATLLVGAFAVACFVHAGVLAFPDRILRQRRPYLNRVLAATKNPTRLALLLIALAIVLQDNSESDQQQRQSRGIFGCRQDAVQIGPPLPQYAIRERKHAGMHKACDGKCANQQRRPDRPGGGERQSSAQPVQFL